MNEFRKPGGHGGDDASILGGGKSDPRAYQWRSRNAGVKSLLKYLFVVPLKEQVNEIVRSRTGGAGHCGEAWRRDAPARSPYNDRARWILYPSSGAKNSYYHHCFLLIQQLSYLIYECLLKSHIPDY